MPTIGWNPRAPKTGTRSGLLAKNAIVHAEVERAVNAANEGVSRAESVRKFEILPDEFTEANGMLTPSLKTRRAQIVEHYRELIDDVIYVPLKK